MILLIPSLSHSLLWKYPWLISFKLSVSILITQTSLNVYSHQNNDIECLSCVTKTYDTIPDSGSKVKYVFVHLKTSPIFTWVFFLIKENTFLWRNVFSISHIFHPRNWQSYFWRGPTLDDLLITGEPALSSQVSVHIGELNSCMFLWCTAFWNRKLNMNFICFIFKTMSWYCSMCHWSIYVRNMYTEGKLIN